MAQYISIVSNFTPLTRDCHELIDVGSVNLGHDSCRRQIRLKKGSGWFRKISEVEVGKGKEEREDSQVEVVRLLLFFSLSRNRNRNNTIKEGRKMGRMGRNKWTGME